MGARGKLMNSDKAHSAWPWTSLPLWSLFSYRFFFLCGPFLKSLLNLLQYCFCFMFWLFWPQCIWDLSSPTRDQTHTPCTGRWSLNHWTIWEVPMQPFLIVLLDFCFSTSEPYTTLCKGMALLVFSSVQLLGCFWLFATPWTAARQASLSITNCQTLPKLMSIESSGKPIEMYGSIFNSIPCLMQQVSYCQC